MKFRYIGAKKKWKNQFRNLMNKKNKKGTLEGNKKWVLKIKLGSLYV